MLSRMQVCAKIFLEPGQRQNFRDKRIRVFRNLVRFSLVTYTYISRVRDRVHR